jgi:hypothetical protein
MKDKVDFLEENKDLAQKIVMLYQILFDFEEKKKKQLVAINPKVTNEKPKSTIFENKGGR